ARARRCATRGDDRRRRPARLPHTAAPTARAPRPRAQLAPRAPRRGASRAACDPRPSPTLLLAARNAYGLDCTVCCGHDLDDQGADRERLAFIGNPAEFLDQ